MSRVRASARAEAARTDYRVVVRRANDLAPEDARDPGAQWLLARGAAAVTFQLRRRRRRWRVELRHGDSLALSRVVEHLSAARALAEVWRHALIAGAHVDDLP